MNESVECAKCHVPGQLPTGQRVMIPRPMELIGQFQVRGRDTWRFHCMGCNGKASIQHMIGPDGKVVVDPRTGRPRFQQVRLTGADEEYRPNSIRPHEQLQIEAAYTIGGNSAAKRVPAQPIQAPEPAYSLDPRQQNAMLNPDHPMHPANLRRRMLGQ